MLRSLSAALQEIGRPGGSDSCDLVSMYAGAASPTLPQWGRS